MLDHTLKISRVVVFDVKCLAVILRNSPKWNNDDIEVVI